MNIFNSLTKQVENFIPLQDSVVQMYSCGPTVYNNLHIGNLSAFIYADLLRRILSSAGYNVTHVMNITDVDDKTIRDSKLAYPTLDPTQALTKLTDTYRDVFYEDMQKTGNDLGAIKFISAVESIPDMITMTQTLLDNGVAYIAEDGVYFSVSRYIDSGHPYGILQSVNIAKSQQRVANDEYDKESASDFALWKKSAANEPSWVATYQYEGSEHTIHGRPGWHIECSAMSEKLLGTPFDIHTGGIDLKFPHHENEIAQSCGSGHESLARYFVHNNHLLVDGKKMSKSLGNFYTLRDVEDKGYSAVAFRLSVLEGHYRSESNFSWDILQAAQNRLYNWMATADLRWQRDEAPATDELLTLLLNSVQNDMDIPRALAMIDSYFDEMNENLLAPHSAVIEFIENVLGIPIIGPDCSEDVKKLLSQRAEARQDKDWTKSDELRDLLSKQCIGVNDSPVGQIWFRKQ